MIAYLAAFVIFVGGRSLADRATPAASVISHAALRSALLDPRVRKHRVARRLPGYRIDAEDLRAQIVWHTKQDHTGDDVDAAIRAAGGQRLPRGPLEIARTVLRGPVERRATYWLSETAYRQATRADGTRGA